MKAVIISKNNEILAILNQEVDHSVHVAGAVANNGAPVNVREYKVSKSKANLARASRSNAEYASRHEHNGQVFFTLN